MAALTIEKLSLRQGPRTLVDGLDLTLDSGQFWAVLGPNGSGKTTLLQCLAGWHAPARGHVLLDGEDLAAVPPSRRARRIALLGQDAMGEAEATVTEEVSLGRHPWQNWWGRQTGEDRRRIRAAMEQMDLLGLEDRRLGELSGGERRRAVLAQSLAQDSRIWLADEPLNHLDPCHQRLVLQTCRQRCRQKHTLALTVLHDLNQAAAYASHCLLLFGDGRWRAGPRDAVLTTDTLSELYRVPVRRIEDGDGGVVFVWS